MQKTIQSPLGYLVVLDVRLNVAKSFQIKSESLVVFDAKLNAAEFGANEGIDVLNISINAKAVTV